MEAEKTIGLVIAVVSVIGGLGIGGVAVYVGTTAATKEKIAAIEAKNKERLALIEKGLDISVLEKKEYKSHGYGPLMWGLLCTGIGFGTFIGYLLSAVVTVEQGISINSMGLMFGGIGLITYFMYKRSMESKKAQQ